MNKLISIIIPAYNSGRYIKGAIDSVLAQTYQPTEIIVINDGSTDNTSEIVAQFQGPGARGQGLEENNRPSSLVPRPSSIIKCIPLSNLGAGAARNAGIKDAQGEFVAFLDADDVWAPDKLARQMERFEQDSEIGLVYTGTETIDENDCIITSGHRRERPEGHIFKQLFMQNTIVTSSVMARRACFETAGMFDETPDFIEDYDMWLRIAAAYKVGYVHEPLTVYRHHAGGISKRIARAYYGEKAVIEKHHALAREKYGLTDHEWRRRLGWLFFEFGYDYLEARDLRAAREQFRAAWHYHKTPRHALYYCATFLPAAILYALKTP